MVNLPVLVLNSNYEPLNICRVRRAVVLIYNGKAEILENGKGFIHSIDEDFSIPSVIKLASPVKRPRPKTRRLTRFEIFNRDHYTCQYCGKESHQLTLDHVLPRHRGGGQTWENVVSACVNCNRKKAGRTPAEAGMMLMQRPGPPHNGGFFSIPYAYRTSHSEWQKYLPTANN